MRSPRWRMPGRIASLLVVALLALWWSSPDWAPPLTTDVLENHGIQVSELVIARPGFTTLRVPRARFIHRDSGTRVDLTDARLAWRLPTRLDRIDVDAVEIDVRMPQSSRPEKGAAGDGAMDDGGAGSRNTGNPDPGARAAMDIPAPSELLAALPVSALEIQHLSVILRDADTEHRAEGSLRLGRADARVDLRLSGDLIRTPIAVIGALDARDRLQLTLRGAETPVLADAQIRFASDPGTLDLDARLHVDEALLGALLSAPGSAPPSLSGDLEVRLRIAPDGERIVLGAGTDLSLAGTSGDLRFTIGLAPDASWRLARSGGAISTDGDLGLDWTLGPAPAAATGSGSLRGSGHTTLRGLDGTREALHVRIASDFAIEEAAASARGTLALSGRLLDGERLRLEAGPVLRIDHLALAPDATLSDLLVTLEAPGELALAPRPSGALRLSARAQTIDLEDRQIDLRELLLELDLRAQDTLFDADMRLAATGLSAIGSVHHDADTGLTSLALTRLLVDLAHTPLLASLQTAFAPDAPRVRRGSLMLEQVQWPAVADAPPWRLRIGDAAVDLDDARIEGIDIGFELVPGAAQTELRSTELRIEAIAAPGLRLGAVTGTLRGALPDWGLAQLNSATAPAAIRIDTAALQIAPTTLARAPDTLGFSGALRLEPLQWPVQDHGDALSLLVEGAALGMADLQVTGVRARLELSPGAESTELRLETLEPARLRGEGFSLSDISLRAQGEFPELAQGRPISAAAAQHFLVQDMEIAVAAIASDDYRVADLRASGSARIDANGHSAHLAVTAASAEVTVPARAFACGIAVQDERMVLTDCGVDLLGGRVVVPSARVDLTTLDGYLPVALQGLDLGAVLLLMQDDALQGDGIIDGALPLRLEAGTPVVRDGYVGARPPGGRLRYAADAALLQRMQQPGLSLAMAALGDFRYDTLGAYIDYERDGTLGLRVALGGTSPQVENGRQIRFNLSVTQNLPLLLQSLRLSQTISERIERRLRERRRAP